MKKVISFIIAAAMLSAAVYAEEAIEVAYTSGSANGENGLPQETFPEFGNIQQYLAENGYPDYVSFVFNSGVSVNGYDPSSGEEYQPKTTYWWEVGTVNATAEQKAVIQALIEELYYPFENTITFVDCSYSYSEREKLVTEIRETVAELFPNAETISVSLIINTEQIGVTIDFPESDDTDFDTVKEKLYGLYGDLVFVEFAVGTDDGHDFGGAIPETGMGDGTEIAMEAAPEDGETAPAIGGDVDSAPTVGEIAAIAPAEKPADSTILWICVSAALIIVLGTIAFICRAKLIPVFAASHGDVTAKKTSRAQTEEAVKSSGIAPDDNVLQAIKETIDKATPSD